LRGAGRWGLILGGAGALLSSPAWFKRLVRSEWNLAYAADRLQELIRKAPAARYWVSSQSGANCEACHTPAEYQADPRHHHQEASIKCLLCAQACLIAPGERGGCRARFNDRGTLRSLVYGRPISIHTDPIEKKPFYHFLPGSAAYSLATSGCPLHCRFCQNWEISQIRPEDYEVAYTPPEQIVNAASTERAPIIAFTYNEPTVFIEYLTDIARCARDKGQRCVLISCGFMNEAPLQELCSVLDAIKIDLKGFSPDFYRKVCSAELAPVLRSIKQVSRSGVHLEIVNLVVPTLNDSDEMLNGLTDWIAGELGPDVPVHFTRFHPDYQLLNLPPTPVATLEKARDMALKKGIHYPFVGNVPGHPGNNSYCPKCGAIVIERAGFFVSRINMIDGKCKNCGQAIAGVWS